VAPKSLKPVNYHWLLLLVQPEGPIILFDGVCNFCNSTVNFLIKQDKKNVLRFAALQSQTGEKLLAENNLSTEGFQSFILIQNDKIYLKSDAALKVLSYLPWYWKELQVLRIIPRFLRDAIYDFIARNRYKWFGKKERCMVPTGEIRERFL
jgi:predicted DCC family thiol-disulfide oxidoreductase YuxK